ncbi:MAG: sodium:solute symporter [bacterium]|nr:sodium:solute symporter [bacterium]
MSPVLFFTVIVLYFAALIIISRITAKKADSSSYFIGNKQSPWYLVAFGMLSDSLSGVTYISVPGAVLNQSLTYLQVVFGYFLGYFIIVYLLLPLYYRLNLISIYSYLQQRFGKNAQKTGAFFFLISRLLGAGGRLMLAIGVMQLFVFEQYHIPFALTAFIFIGLMLLYTYKGGIKTLVYTDAFQSLFLILGVVLSVVAIATQLDFNIVEVYTNMTSSKYSKMIETDWLKGNYWLKDVVSGALFTVAMTGLDQNMMQKNLSLKSLKDAQKNMLWFSVVMLIISTLFVSLGALLYQYADTKSIVLATDAGGKVLTDNVFPTLALGHFGTLTALAFIIGLTAATFSSADSVLATLTTSFCIDFLRFGDGNTFSEKKQKNIRHAVHIGFAIILLLVIVVLKYAIESRSTIKLILTMATYTYGPLIGLFAAGLFTKIKFSDKWIPLICLISPLFCYFLNIYDQQWLGGYDFGNEIILVNGLLTFLFLLLLKNKDNELTL